MLLRCFLLVGNIAFTTCLAVADEDPLRELNTQESVTRGKKKGSLSLARRAQSLVEANVAAALKEEVLAGLYAPVSHLGHCPEGWSFIRTRSECSKAAAYLSFKDHADVDHGWPDRPGGCFVHDEHKEVYFNKLMGSVSQEDRQICAAAMGQVGQTLLARTPSAKKARQIPMQVQNATLGGDSTPEMSDETQGGASAGQEATAAKVQNATLGGDSTAEMSDETQGGASAGQEATAIEAQNATLRSESAADKSNQTQSVASAGQNTTAPKVPPRAKPKPELKDTKDGLSPHGMIPGYPHRPGGPNARPLKSANRFKPNPKEYDVDGELKDTPWGVAENRKPHWKGNDIIANIFDPQKPHAKPEDYDEEGELTDTYNGLRPSKDYEEEPKQKYPFMKPMPGHPKPVASKVDALKHQREHATRDRIDRVHAARAAEEAKARRPMEKVVAKEAKAKRKANAKVKEARIKAVEKAEHDAERAQKAKSKDKSVKAQRFDSGEGEDVEGGKDPVAQLLGSNESRKLSSESRKLIKDTLEYKQILAEEMPGAVEKDRKQREEAQEKEDDAKFKEAAAYHSSTMKQAKAILRKKVDEHKAKSKAHFQHMKFQLAEPGQRCAEGWQAVMNQTICKEVATSLGGEDYTSWAHKFTTRPRGCYVHPNHKGQRQFNFNPSKTGELNFEDQVVCLKAPEGHKTKLLELAARPTPDESYWNQRVEETEVLQPQKVSEEELIGPGEPMWKRKAREQKRLVNDVKQMKKKEQKVKDKRLEISTKYDQQVQKEADRKVKLMNSVSQGPFKLAEPGARCPEYYVPVTNRTLCRRAAKLWEGKDMVDIWQKTKKWADRPKGCFIHKISRDPEHGVLPMEFNFNGDKKGELNFQDQFVCVDATSKAAREMAVPAPKPETVAAAHAKK